MNSSVDVMHQTIKKIILRFSEQTKEDRIYRKARELFFCQRFKDVLTLTLKQDGLVPCICLAMLGFQAIIWYYRHNSFPFLSRPKLCPIFLKREKLQVIQGLCCLHCLGSEHFTAKTLPTDWQNFLLLEQVCCSILVCPTVQFFN